MGNYESTEEQSLEATKPEEIEPESIKEPEYDFDTKNKELDLKIKELKYQKLLKSLYGKLIVDEKKKELDAILVPETDSD